MDIRISLGEITTRVIAIGLQGENDHAQVVFDASGILGEYPDATAALTVKPPHGNIYPKAVEKSGNTVTWVVSSSDCAYPGNGEYQLTFTNGETIIKSFVGNMRVFPSLIANGTAPDPVGDWMQEAQAALGELEDLSASAEDLPAGSQATAEITQVGGHKNILIGVPAGQQGIPGQDGTDGQDGFSPVISVTDISGGHRVVITSAEGSQTFDVMDGTDGTDGQDGYSPTVTVQNITGGHRVTITDASGDHSFDVMDGQGADIIDDNAGSGDTDKTWSANKLAGEFSNLSSAISNIENLDPNIVLSGTYSGTQYKKIDHVFPAGTYHLSIENITSSDTDKTQCLFKFANGSTELWSEQFDRGVAIERYITLESSADSILLYASISYPYGSGDTFSFNGLEISIGSKLINEINGIKEDINDVKSEIGTLTTKEANDISKLKNSFGTITGNTDIDISTVGYITISGSTYNKSTVVTSSDYVYAVVPCSEGDIFTITGRGGNDPRLWAFGDGTNVLSSADASANVTDEIIIAPANTTELIINVRVAYDFYCVTGSLLSAKVENLYTMGEIPTLQNIPVKAKNVLDNFALNSVSYNFTSSSNIKNYANYATASTVAKNTPPIQIRDFNGNLIYKNLRLNLDKSGKSTTCMWLFGKSGYYLRSVSFSNFYGRTKYFLDDEYYAILNSYPNTSGYTDYAWIVDNINIEWLNSKPVYYVGEGRDFSTFTGMLTALANDSTEKTVYVLPGEYDIFTEMGGAEYIASVAPSASELNWRDVCHVVPPNTTIIGLGNVVLSWEPTAEQMVNETTAFLFSPLNVSGNCHIENISVVAKNCRYVVHDETSGLAEYNGAKHFFKNCRFTLLSGSYGFILYGAGHNKLMEVKFEDCVFDSQNSSMIWSTHDWTTAVNEQSTFTINNCVFTSTKSDPYVRFSSGDSVGRLDRVMFNNCYLQKIKFVTTSGSNAKQGYDVQLIGCSPVEVEYDEHVTDRVAVMQYNPIPQST